MTVASALSINPSLSTTSPPSSPSPARSRHRRLSALRNYTHHRLSSHHSTDSNDEAESRPSPRTTAPRPISYPGPRALSPRNLPDPSSPLSPRDTSEISRNEQVNSDSRQGHSSFRRLSGFRRQKNQSAPTNTQQANSASAGQRFPFNNGQREAQDSTMTHPRGNSRTSSTVMNSQELTRSLSGVGAVVLPVDSTTIPPTSNGSAADQPVASEDGQQQTDGRTRLPTLRLFPHQDARPGRPSLHFTPITRTLPAHTSIIRVGRYSEREGAQIPNPTTPSDAPIGFKSKVVSRKHCEFSFSDGKWHIKDVKSSSGTFLNHIRLSQPNSESRLFPVKDGDIVQLGIDFRGGEEAIFRCVKIRVECNRSWQKRPNNFNKNRHAQLQSLSKDTSADTKSSGECSICLGTVTPCQSLFVAACAHVWHFKCIRPMLVSRSYPQFTCPNCRAVTDLEAEVDQVDEDWDEDEWVQADGDNTSSNGRISNGSGNSIPQAPLPALDILDTIGEFSLPDAATTEESDAIMTDAIEPTDPSENEDQSQVEPYYRPGGLEAINIPNAAISFAAHGGEDMLRAPTPENPTAADVIAGEGPLTPRNNAGPFVFDGSAGRASAGHRMTQNASPVIGTAR